jgi:hypothetical protein
MGLDLWQVPILLCSLVGRRRIVGAGGILPPAGYIGQPSFCVNVLFLIPGGRLPVYFSLTQLNTLCF